MSQMMNLFLNYVILFLFVFCISTDIFFCISFIMFLNSTTTENLNLIFMKCLFLFLYCQLIKNYDTMAFKATIVKNNKNNIHDSLGLNNIINIYTNYFIFIEKIMKKNMKLI